MAIASRRRDGAGRGIGREHARRVDRAIVDGFPLQSCHEVMFLPIVTASGTGRPRPAEDVAARFRPSGGFGRAVGWDALSVEPVEPGAHSSVYGFERPV